MLIAFKIATIFTRTLRYYAISFARPQDIPILKKKWATKAMKDLGYEIEVAGVPPEANNQPLILVGNHISYLDIMLLMSVHPDIVFIAKKEVRGFPVIGKAAERAGTLFVDREARHDRAKMRVQIADALNSSKAQVVVFPSGTTTLDENKTWKKGVFEIAHEHSIPVKAFKIHYSPLRESAYIDDDTLLGQMHKAFKAQNKFARLTWLSHYHIKSPIEDAERIRQDVLK